MEVFGIGLPELLVILVLTLIVVGPQRLPEMAAQLGRLVRDFRRYTSELSRDITDALQDIEKEDTQVKEEGKEGGRGGRGRPAGGGSPQGPRCPAPQRRPPPP